tara:strand:+ start:23 stop:841 length:819 start_codon:yes stop_codon:yes gene_type:complete
MAAKGVTTLTITDSGERFSFLPYVTFTLPDEDSRNAGGLITLDDSGKIASITITDSGNYYTSPPTVIVATDSANDSASVTALVTRGQVSGFTIADSGFGMDSCRLIITAPNGTPGDFVAQARALIDSSAEKVSKLILVDSGNFYLNPPTMLIHGGNNIESSYERDDNIEQTLSSGVKIRGEVLNYLLDSDGDSARVLRVGHVGADDGKFREFVVNRQVVNASQSFTKGLEVVGVDQENRMSENEQNEFFTTSDIDDFLNFSEDNPFGDPEAQ